MDMKQLHCFITVVEQKSITKAAEKLYITQPAMSRITKSFIVLEFFSANEGIGFRAICKLIIGVKPEKLVGPEVL